MFLVQTTFAPIYLMIIRYAQRLSQSVSNESHAIFQMFVPNGVGAFGSTSKEIDDLDEGWNFYLTQTHWKYRDRPSQRCNENLRYDLITLVVH